MPDAKVKNYTALLTALASLPIDRRAQTLQEVLAGDQGRDPDCQLLGGYRLTRGQLEILLALRAEARETVDFVNCLQIVTSSPIVWDDVAFI